MANELAKAANAGLVSAMAAKNARRPANVKFVVVAYTISDPTAKKLSCVHECPFKSRT